MPADGATVAAEARLWIGTPWHHQARLRSVGVDCGGLVVGVARDLGLPLDDYPPGYGRHPDGRSLRAWIEARFTRIAAMEEGAMPLMEFTPGLPQHVGIVTRLAGGWGLVHAWAQLRRVVEHPITDDWTARICRDGAGPLVYRLPGIV
ncbi:peptidase [Siccirubricoccus deserti]|uniref:NlpC/P60 domain-containing protein n=1 Tax=Siccirubricoccus deserti TaxID=2013562 RepID=A0A9X0UFQ3_9PROT|nr:hypothetical protein [Siccirubricoccus deserti]MBC4019017.1 hypothetical protein [Siccirubricoccus deserti]GGC70277.1 peptidase [Siccirubricoccus deserti]